MADGGDRVTPDTISETSEIARLEARLSGLLANLRRTAPRRLSAATKPERVKAVLRVLRDELGYRHLSAISAVDLGTSFELLYHMSAADGMLVSVRTSVSRDAPRLTTVSDLLPAATLYEREIHDLFGVEFEGHPDPRPLLLYEGWPPGEYPLRKDWKSRQGGMGSA